jgi:hypothetical protein
MPGTTGKGLPFPSAGDPVNVHGDIQSLANATDGVFNLYVTRATATTKGDLLVATGASTLTRLPIGVNGQVLVADSTQTSGVRWVDEPEQLEINLIMGAY